MPPGIRVNDAQITESLTGTALLPFTIDLQPGKATPVFITYATANGTAIAGVDYQAMSGTLTFTPGQVQQTVYVPVFRRFVAEADKTLTLTITNPGNDAQLIRAVATGTIHDVGTVAVPIDQQHRAVYRDYLNNPVTILLRGPGSGTLVFLGTSSTQTNAFEILLTGTDPTSSLFVATARGQQTSFQNIVVTGSLSAVVARTSNLTGQFTATGSVNTLAMNFLQAATLTVGGGSGALNLALGRVLDTTITSAIPINSLVASAYLNTDNVPDRVTAPSIGVIRVAGGFEGVTVQTGAFTALAVGGSIKGSTIRTTGNIGLVMAAGISNSTIFAGVSPDLTTLPTSSSDFTNQSANIGRVLVRAAGFSNTLIASWKIGAMALGPVHTTTTTGTAFGVTANHIATVLGTGTATPLRLIAMNAQSHPSSTRISPCERSKQFREWIASGLGRMPVVKRWSFNVLAGLSLLAFIAITALWIRSYFAADIVESTTTFCAVGCGRGRLVFERVWAQGRASFSAVPPLTWHSRPPEDFEISGDNHPLHRALRWLGFEFIGNRHIGTVTIC